MPFMVYPDLPRAKTRFPVSTCTAMPVLRILACVLTASAAVAQSQAEFPNRGVIYGTVTAQDGTPAKGLTLNAEPLGVALIMALPWTKTDDTGAFRFEHLQLRRYTVFAEDSEQGYSSFSTGRGGPGNPPEVELTSEHPEAEFDFHLPPKAGFLMFHLTNLRTGAAISGVEVTVMSAEKPSKFIFSEGSSSTKPILVPSDESLLIHVTSWGFHEWDQSVGKGMPIRIAPGDRLTLDVQLVPANPLRERIPDADPTKYRGIHEGKDWRNPCLIVRADGIVISGVTNEGNPIPVKAVAAALEGLPDSAWPYGSVVAVQANGTRLRKPNDPGFRPIGCCLSRFWASLG